MASHSKKRSVTANPSDYIKNAVLAGWKASMTSI
jgi:hypothetical protein